MYARHIYIYLCIPSYQRYCIAPPWLSQHPLVTCVGTEQCLSSTGNSASRALSRKLPKHPPASVTQRSWPFVIMSWVLLILLNAHATSRIYQTRINGRKTLLMRRKAQPRSMRMETSLGKSLMNHQVRSQTPNVNGNLCRKSACTTKRCT